MTKAKPKARTGWNGLAYWAAEFQWSPDQQAKLAAAGLPLAAIDGLAEMVGDEMGQAQAGIPSAGEVGAALDAVRVNAAALAHALAGLDELSADSLEAHLETRDAAAWARLRPTLAALSDAARRALAQSERREDSFAGPQIRIAGLVRRIFTHHSIPVADNETGQAAEALAAVLAALGLPARSPRYYLFPNRGA